LTWPRPFLLRPLFFLFLTLFFSFFSNCHECGSRIGRGHTFWRRFFNVVVEGWSREKEERWTTETSGLFEKSCCVGWARLVGLMWQKIASHQLR
jgi:hypothetical protein